MLHVSIFVEGLRSRPQLMFWLAALVQGAIWWLVPSIFYAAPPGELPEVLAVGHEFQLGTDLGPPLAFWLADIIYMILGIGGGFPLAEAPRGAASWGGVPMGAGALGAP